MTVINGSVYTAEELAIIEEAKSILASKMEKDIYVTGPNTVRDYLITNYSNLEHEVFGVIFLNNKHGIIKTEIMFNGTIDAAGVYPREIAKKALEHNAAAVILFHNHPSGTIEPSHGDKVVTRKVVDGLGMLDIRTLDHLIVAGGHTFSFAERGLI